MTSLLEVKVTRRLPTHWYMGIEYLTLNLGCCRCEPFTGTCTKDKLHINFFSCNKGKNSNLKLLLARVFLQIKLVNTLTPTINPKLLIYRLNRVISLNICSDAVIFLPPIYFKIKSKLQWASSVYNNDHLPVIYCCQNN